MERKIEIIIGNANYIGVLLNYVLKHIYSLSG